jgi:antitoxin component YwqK of YwqJK toxin-antitoxin module
MRAIIYFILLFILISSTAFAWWETRYDTVEVRWGNGNLKEYYTRAWFTGHEDGYKPHGQYKSWYENGQLKEDGCYRWNRKIGTWIKWDENGSRQEEISYCDGGYDPMRGNFSTINGQYIEWYPGNIIKTIGYFKNDLKYGLWINKIASDDPNNPDLLIKSVDYYYKDTLLVKLEGHQGERLNDTAVFYNAEMDLWTEWKRNNYADWLGVYTDFYIGKKIDGKKNGKWLHLDSCGETVDMVFYRDDREVLIK